MYVEVTVINNKKETNVEGFVKNNNFSLVFTIDKNTLVKDFLDFANKYRYQQINFLFNENGGIVKKNFSINKNSAFYLFP